jgi:hypothetical protein
MDHKNFKSVVYLNDWQCDINISAENVEKIFVENIDVPLYKISNLKMFYDESLEIKKFSNQQSFIWIFDNYFFHQTIENNSQYDFIKTIIPNIKPVFMNITRTASRDDNEINIDCGEKSAVVFNKDMYNIYKEDTEDQNIYDFSQYVFHFDEVYMFVPHKDFLVGIIPQRNHLSGFYRYGQEGYWNNPAILSMRKRFLKLLKKDSNMPSNIFISRADSVPRYKEFLDYYESLKEEEKTEELTTRANFFKTRVCFKEDTIKKYYESKGYVSVCFENMPYLNQLEYIYNAKNIATVIGSACINLFVADKDTKYREIHVDDGYVFSYDFMCNLLDIKMNKINLSKIIDNDDLVARHLEENDENF